MHVPPGFGVITPYIVVADAAAYMRFLVEALGAVEIGRTDREGRVIHGELRLGATHFMVGGASPEFPPDRASLYLFVDDAGATVTRALSHGATLVQEVGDKPYGDRQGGIRDPAGNTWWISQRLSDAAYY